MKILPDARVEDFFTLLGFGPWHISNGDRVIDSNDQVLKVTDSISVGYVGTLTTAAFQNLPIFARDGHSSMGDAACTTRVILNVEVFCDDCLQDKRGNPQLHGPNLQFSRYKSLL